MRFIIGFVLGILFGMWLQSNHYALRLPFAPERDVQTHVSNQEHTWQMN